MIGRRLNRLSQRCNEALTVASVIGREFTLDQLRPLSEDTSEDRLFEILEEALAGRVIEGMHQAVGRYQFTHALIQETLTAELSLTRRVRLHARIAETLEASYGPEADAHAAELAHHFAQAESVTGVERLVHYSQLAGDRDLNVRAYEEASSHFQLGLTAKGVALTGTEPAEDGEAAALLAGLGQARLGTQELWNSAQAVETLVRGFDYYVTAGDSERAVTIALFDFRAGAGRQLVDRALTLVPPDTHEAGRLQARHILPLRADYDRAQEAFHQAVNIARQKHDEALEMQALIAAACVDFHHCHNAQSLERNGRAIELAQLVDLPNEESHARHDLMHVLFAMGDLEAATRHAEAMLASAERTRMRLWSLRAMVANEIVSSAKGDWRTSRDFIAQGLAMAPREAILTGASALLEHQLGENDAGEAYLERLLDSVPGGWSNLPGDATATNFALFAVPAVVIPLVARITGEMTRFDVVEGLTRSIFSSPDAIPALLNAARIGLAMIAVQRGDTTAAGELYGALQPITGTSAPQGLYGPAIVVDRVLGLLSQTMGNLDQAVARFEGASAFCRKGGFRPELAWACCDYADASRDRDAAGDPAMALTLLDESLAISSELGMRPLMERVLSRREILKA